MGRRPGDHSEEGPVHYSVTTARVWPQETLAVSSPAWAGPFPLDMWTLCLAPGPCT